MLNVLIKGGPVLWAIILLAFIGTAIVIERILYFRKIRVDEEKLFLRIKSSLEKGHFDEALYICDTNYSPLSVLIKVGIEHRDHPEHIQREVIKDAANQEVPRLEKNLSGLGTIAHIAPLLGLLGTVTGTMKTFGVLGQFGAVTDPGILATGISEALITTVAGILVAVPAVIFYNYLVTKVNLLLIKMENQVNSLILMINASKKRQGAS
ncbi:MotA/TolQ/ExbB proton channel family protein [Spirochaeta thermophila]|uniref:Probable tolQ-type transport protein n=1 Tax=Winmispira thermophila (strain ATCC 49972 / DSM 6192 / RI 19.B1) TaxID=665571 RepID=E0RSA0_WINT6|nr:MotA/TolQ/ExbB proton channel family protein [Spirochaeta thermophila]ADN01887.1 probable tolQ-type transport protein [Spirochaeta thermophila DSM 6192]